MCTPCLVTFSVEAPTGLWGVLFLQQNVDCPYVKSVHTGFLRGWPLKEPRQNIVATCHWMQIFQIRILPPISISCGWIHAAHKTIPAYLASKVLSAKCCQPPREDDKHALRYGLLVLQNVQKATSSVSSSSCNVHHHWCRLFLGYVYFYVKTWSLIYTNVQFLWVWNLGSLTLTEKQTKGVWEQDTEGDIGT
jgi:hypothetical protein